MEHCLEQTVMYLVFSPVVPFVMESTSMHSVLQLQRPGSHSQHCPFPHCPMSVLSLSSVNVTTFISLEFLYFFLYLLHLSPSCQQSVSLRSSLYLCYLLQFVIQLE